MRRARGALAMVLCVSMLLFIIAVGFATMVSLQLNLTSTSLASHQAEMAARAATAQVQYEIDQKMRQYWTQPVPLSGATPITLNLGARFSDPTSVFPAPTPDSPATCQIAFDTKKAFYSTDNIDGALPADGWFKQQGENVEVPANSVDLLVQARVGGATRIFESVLSQQWPYAACSLSGPLTATNCNVIGNLYAGTAPLDGPAIQLGIDNTTNAGASAPPSTCLVQGDLCTWLPPGTPDPLAILTGATVEGRNCYNVALGGSVPGAAGDAPPPDLVSLLKVPVSASATYAALPIGATVPLSDIDGMSLTSAATGGTTVSGGVQAQIQGNQLILNGQVVGNVKHVDPGNPPAHFDAPGGSPSSIWMPCTDQSMEIPTENGDTFNTQYLANTQFITSALALNNGFYYLNGSLVNRASQFTQQSSPPPPPPPKSKLPPPPQKNQFVDSGTFIISNGGTLKLTNTVLVVSGDVDVAGIDGQNSVLIVGGRLTLTGGQMNAENKGIVILANHVVLRARGKFLGLVISQNALESFTFKSNGPKLSVRGGLLSAGAMTLSNTDVQWDPYFLQIVNRFGSITTTLFRQITQ